MDAVEDPWYSSRAARAPAADSDPGGARRRSIWAVRERRRCTSHIFCYGCNGNCFAGRARGGSSAKNDGFTTSTETPTARKNRQVNRTPPSNAGGGGRFRQSPHSYHRDRRRSRGFPSKLCPQLESPILTKSPSRKTHAVMLPWRRTLAKWWQQVRSRRRGTLCTWGLMHQQAAFPEGGCLCDGAEVGGAAMVALSC